MKLFLFLFCVTFFFFLRSFINDKWGIISPKVSFFKNEIYVITAVMEGIFLYGIFGETFLNFLK